MTHSQNGQHQLPLPAELAATLRHATANTLGAFTSLRAALREHVQSERSRGASLAQIDADLRSMIGHADGTFDGDHSVQHIDALTAQMLSWSEAIYSRTT